jgi:hypothetical protein
MAQFKLNQGFNEDDFVVDAVLDPADERHSIFELNLPDKLCLFRLGDGTYTTLTLKDEHITALQEALSPVWHNEGDKLQIFAMFNDGEYFCQRLLSKFDFATKTVTNRKYEFNELTYAEATEVFEIAKAVCWIRTEQQAMSLESDLVNIAETDNFAEGQEAKRKAERNNLLKITDFRMLPDYDGEHKEQWTTYRATLRTIPKAQDQFEDRAEWLAYLAEMPFPVDPNKWAATDELKDLEYLSTDAFWSTITTLHSSEADKLMAEKLLQMKARKSQIDKYGKTVARELSETISKYRLDEKMLDFDFESYTVGG